MARPWETVSLEKNTQHKRWRVYFNCRDHFPALWCVDEGSIQSQIRVQHVQFLEVEQAIGNTDMGKTKKSQGESDPQWEPANRKGKPNEPLVWIEFEAVAIFGGGGVVFYGKGPFSR